MVFLVIYEMDEDNNRLFVEKYSPRAEEIKLTHDLNNAQVFTLSNLPSRYKEMWLSDGPWGLAYITNKTEHAYVSSLSKLRKCLNKINKE